MRFFGLGLIILPLIEIALFVVVGRAIGVLPTLALVVLAVVGGLLVLRQQGLSVLSRLRSNVSAGTIPGQAMMDGLLLGVAGMLLIVPGFFTDAVALLLLVPAVRAFIFTSMAGRVRVVETTTSYRRQSDADAPQVTNGPVVDLDDDDWRRDRP